MPSGAGVPSRHSALSLNSPQFCVRVGNAVLSQQLDRFKSSSSTSFEIDYKQQVRQRTMLDFAVVTCTELLID